jgi:hypothetical protein
VTLVHWLNRDLWGPIWPNLAASAICGVGVYLRVRVHLVRQHEAHERTRALLVSLHHQLGAEMPEDGQ